MHNTRVTVFNEETEMYKHKCLENLSSKQLKKIQGKSYECSSLKEHSTIISNHESLKNYHQHLRSVSLKSLVSSRSRPRFSRELDLSGSKKLHAYFLSRRALATAAFLHRFRPRKIINSNANSEPNIAEKLQLQPTIVPRMTFVS